MKRILVLEPYFGGSHKQFLEGLKKHVRGNYVFLTLPARKWKMRMQLSAPWFVEQVKAMENRHFDTVLCSTFVDVAVFRSLVAGIDGWNNNYLLCTYFHENQFVYPSRSSRELTHQFTAINFTTALASDRIAFNSEYNRNSFFEKSAAYISKASDMMLKGVIEEVRSKTTVLYPGMDYEDFDNHGISSKKISDMPVLLWNHRWEHDKNPEGFFDALDALDRQGVQFNLIVLGQSFVHKPEVFDHIPSRFAKNIIHFGYAESRKEYIDLLCKADIAVSTALHEFFGIAMIEAVKAGAFPVVPNRLSYPEIYPEECLYGEGQLVEKLKKLIEYQALPDSSIDVTRFQWQNLAGEYALWLGVDE